MSTGSPSTGPAIDAPRPALTRRLKVIVVVLVLFGAFLPIPTVSYAAALAAPGQATWQVRTVDWLRDHGGAPLINTVENWYYSQHAPSDSPPDSATVPKPRSGARVAVPAAGSGPATLPVLPGRPRLAGEAQWTPGRTDTRGVPLVYTSWLRPDPTHASVVAGAAWIRQPGTTAHLVAGTTQPGGAVWPGKAAVPPSDVGRLVATFNSGWRMHDIPGGFYLAGRSGPPLIDGQATAAVDDQGRLAVGQWGRDLRPGPHLVGARQNLQLVVDHGRPAPDLSTNSHGQWGTPKNQFQYTSRSGLGVDAGGNLVYVAGTKMNLDTLAAVLVDAGAVRGMELDIHNGMTFFASWLPKARGTATPTKLLPTMTRSASRYLVPDQRDFFYITAAADPATRAP